MNGISFIDSFTRIKAVAKIVDLSYTLEERMPAWPTQARYGSIVYESYDFGDEALHSAIVLSEHTGTHIDAPCHFIPGGRSVDELPPSTVMGRGVKIDATPINPGELFTPDALRKFEAAHGEILGGDVVMFRFGWDTKYGLYPECADYMKNWPGLAGEAAAYLRDRRVAAVGCDTLSLDAYGQEGNPCHHTLLGSGIPIIENICNLAKLPVFSCVIGLPNRFRRGSGSPIRLIAFLEESA